MVEVRVPASSANVGPGYDSFGIALTLYNSIRVSETDKGLYIKNINAPEYIPINSNNLVYRAVIRAFDEVGYSPRGLKISQKSQIPMTRGLGSSSACIVGGLVAGNILSGRQLTSQRIFELANELEGHPDNVAPALFGGFCVSCIDDGKLLRQTIRLKNDIKFVAMVPKYYVGTRKSRNLIPEKIKTVDASFNLSHAASLALSFATGDYKNLSVYCKDKIHQQYRKTVVDDLDDIIEKSVECGALAAYLSGSGPTVIAIINGDDNHFIQKITDYFSKSDIKRDCILLSCDNTGAVAVEK